jgi:Concanavalin A-like lectin/glucanases superfamily/Bacterial Ig domain
MIQIRPSSKVSRLLTAIYLMALLGHPRLFSGRDINAKTYSTAFPLTENPVSEGSSWINGKTVGLDWSDCATMPGFAMGLESGQGGFDDATAILNCSWGPDQTVTARVHTTHQQSGAVFEEVELRLRSTLSAHSCTGYEVLFSLRNDGDPYCQIVRWNGALGDFTYVAATSGSQCIIQDGDEVKATITNQTITAYINGVPILQGTDTTFSSGNPGMGFFIEGATDVNSDYGFTNFTASDGLESPDNEPPTVMLTLPAAAAVISNIVTTSATATDNVAVVGVQFNVDGKNIGAEVTSPPYSAVWDTTCVSNGLHTVQALARDSSCNWAIGSLVVTVSNPLPMAPTDKLVAAYSFGEGFGTTTADLSGNGNTGAIFAGSWTTSGKHGRAISFAGGGMITVNDSNSLDLTNSMTLEAWVYPTIPATNWATLLVKEIPGSFVYALVADPNGRPSAFVSTSGQGLLSATGSTALPLNSWTHVTGTYDGVSLKLYVNGIEVASAPASGNIVRDAGQFRMGGNSIWGEYFVGTIDDVRVHSRALRPAEILADMSTPVGGFPVVTLWAATQTADEIAQNGFKFYLSANSPTTCAVEYTSNFTFWQQLGLFQYTNSPVEVIDPSKNLTTRFYRARQQ